MNDDRYEAIRKRMTERYRSRAEFYGHLIAFLIINGFAWAVIPGTLYESSRSTILTLMALTSVGWFVGMAIHAINFILVEMREHAIDREIERERRWLAGEATGEKPKRSRLERLTDDDGELLDDVLDAQDSGFKRARGS
jgi:hypothetical protein